MTKQLLLIHSTENNTCNFHLNQSYKLEDNFDDNEMYINLMFVLFLIQKRK